MTTLRTYLVKHRTALIVAAVLTSPVWIGLIVNHVMFRLPSTHNEILSGHSALVRSDDQKVYLVKYGLDGEMNREEVLGVGSLGNYEYPAGLGDGFTIKLTYPPVMQPRATTAILSTGAVVFADTNEATTTYRIWKYESGTTTLIRSYPILDLIQFSHAYASGTAHITPETQKMTSNTYRSPFIVFPDDSIGFLDFAVLKGDGKTITQTAVRLRVVDVYGRDDRVVTLAESEENAGPWIALEDMERGLKSTSGEDGITIWNSYMYHFSSIGDQMPEAFFTWSLSEPLFIDKEGEEITFIGYYQNARERFSTSTQVRLVCGTKKDLNCYSNNVPESLTHATYSYDGERVGNEISTDLMVLNSEGTQTMSVSDALFPHFGECIETGSWMVQFTLPFCLAYSRNALKVTEDGQIRTLYAYDELIAVNPKRRFNLGVLSYDHSMVSALITSDAGIQYGEPDRQAIASTYAYDIANDKWALLTDNPSERVLYLR